MKKSTINQSILIILAVFITLILRMYYSSRLVMPVNKASAYARFIAIVLIIGIYYTVKFIKRKR